MISQNKAKFIQSLHTKKIRQKMSCFLVEGAKNVQEVLNSTWEVKEIAATTQFIHENTFDPHLPIHELSQTELEKLGTLQSNDSAIAVVAMPENKIITPTFGQYYLALDEIRDPGNLGTIIRIADWYGIAGIFANHGTAELYNPKVISATMGSFTRVPLYYCELPELLSQTILPTYGTFMNGTSLHQVTFDTGGILVMGNESNGISPEVEELVKHKITIPRFGQAESLNVGIATAICCDALRR
jgi:TrmH family RNA methyltransferase